MAVENKLVVVQAKKEKPSTSSVNKYGMPPTIVAGKKRGGLRSTPNCAHARLSKLSTMGNSSVVR